MLLERPAIEISNCKCSQTFATMAFFDSDYDYDSDDYSDGEPHLILREEVREGDYNAVSTSLNLGSNPNDCDCEHGNYTILHWAAALTDPDNFEEARTYTIDNIEDRRKIVTVLLQHGANSSAIWWQQQFLGNHDGQFRGT